MKLLKSRSLWIFQSGIIGSLWLMEMGSTIMFWSYVLKLSNPYMGLLKSTGSSIMMESFIHGARDKLEGSIAWVFMNGAGAIGVSCLTGDTTWDRWGNGLCMGGVGGALWRANGLSKAKDLVVGVPLYDEFDDTWPWSESELTDARLCV
jgi:hypothetical protein